MTEEKTCKEEYLTTSGCSMVSACSVGGSLLFKTEETGDSAKASRDCRGASW